MSIEKDKFSQMIEKQLNEFEVPFNRDHWDEMSEKLDKIPASGSRNAGLVKKMAIGTTVAVALLSAFFLLNKEEDTPLSAPIDSEIIDSEGVNQSSELKGEESNTFLNENEKASTLVSEDKDEAISSVSPEEKHVDSKLDKYANFSEQSVKEEGKEQVEKLVDEQKSSYVKTTPSIDNPLLKTSIVVEDRTSCVGESISFSVDRTIDGAKYYWNFGDGGLTSRKTNPIHVFKRSGSYTVTLLVSKGEKNDYKVEHEITIKDVPSVKIISQNNEITLNDPYARFECNCSESDKLEWTFNETKNSRGNVVDFLVPDKSSYNVRLVATNEEGCKTIENYTYHAFKGVKMDVENAITPNGNGSNDVFLPKELTISNVDFSLIIMEPSGKIIFETKDKYTPWNGKMNNIGTDLPHGTYLWKVTFTDDRGKLHKQEGVINLIR